MSRKSRPRLLALAGILLLAAAFRVGRREEGAAQAATPDIALQPLATGLGPITSIAHAADGRLFLTLQTGKIVIFSGGQIQPTPFLDLSPVISCCVERGLLGLAFHPQFAANRFFFVDYTNTAGNTVIARYQKAADGANAEPGSGVVLLTILQPFANHNGGQLQFGPDGYLYIGMGDGGSANDPLCNAQRDDTLLGKLLRIDVNQNVNTPPFYGIPPSNPFAAPGTPLDEIWAKGLRNPWRFSFDRVTGDLYIADVGQSAREEIDFQPRASAGGENYGWKIMEGTLCGEGGSSGCPAGVLPCNSPAFKAPLYEYAHVGSGDCTGTVIGGYVYRGTAFPDLAGVYFYGDYCFGWLFGNGQRLTPLVPQLTTFGEDASGELYLGTEDGKLYRLVSSAAPTPTPTPTAPRLTPAVVLRPHPTPRVVTRPPV
jgi:glucose/arabinose dehydrogenase